MSASVTVSRRRLTLALLCLVISIFSARSFFGEGGLLSLSRQKKELETMRIAVESSRERNQHLQAEIADLRNGHAAIERLARERLGYIAKGEVTYLFPEGSSDPPPDPNRPQPGAPPAPADRAKDRPPRSGSSRSPS